MRFQIGCLLSGFRLAAVCCLVGCLLAACGHVPVLSMLKLSRINFQTTDLASLRMAVKLPASIRPQHDKLRLRLTVQLANGAETTQEFVLSEISDPAEIAMLREEAGAAAHVFAYRLDAVEANKLIAFREDLLKKKQEGSRGGGLKINVVPEACRSGEIASGEVLFTTYLRTPETGGYLTLAEDVDIRTLVPGRDLVSEMPTCGPA
jgi:hypothetical protein